MLLNLLYLILLVAAFPWLATRSVRTGRYRDGWGEKLFGSVPKRDGDAECIWLHAVSVGEVRALEPLVRQLTSQRPDLKIVISTTTLTGMQLARSQFAAHSVFYCPLDFTWSVKRAIARIRPSILLLTELELWPNLISAAKKTGCRVAIVNGRLSGNSLRGYQRIRPLIRQAISELDWIGVQDETYQQRFILLGADPCKISITGSLKFDGANSDRNHSEVLSRRRLVQLKSDDIVWVAGSTQDPEEQCAIEAYANLVKSFPKLRLVLVPRHPERFDQVKRLVDASGLRQISLSTLHSHKKSMAAGGNSDSVPNEQDWQVLIGDTIGELSHLWGLATLGFVGGSFGKRGGQNMIEPAAYGVCTCFGPKTANFRDIVRLLLDANAATVLDEPEQMHGWVESMLTNQIARTQLSQQARMVSAKHRGASERTVKAINRLLSNNVVTPLTRAA